MKKLINLCVMVLACSFYTTINCYYPIMANTPLKVYLENETPYSISITYNVTGSPLDKKKWQEGDGDIKPWTSNELIFWKKFGKTKTSAIHTFIITANVQSTPKYKFEFVFRYQDKNLWINFPPTPNIKAINFRNDKIHEYVVGKIRNKKLILSITKSRSYGSGINRYGVIVFNLDLK